MELTINDIGVDVIKTGMLHNKAIIEAIASVIAKNAANVPLVVDPVLASQSGSPLLEKDAIQSLIKHLVSKATIVTPNLPEAEILTGMEIKNAEQMVAAGKKILGLGAQAVLVKGGHLEGNELTDVLLSEEGVEQFHGRRIQTNSTHGTGCTLASAIACCLARGMPLRQAVMSARAYVRNAIKTAPGFGQGHGPLNHYIAF
jgi:hydroxymethylpyrimidine/phosphomethylpyrimidine kinase